MKTTVQGRKKLYILCALCAVLILLVSGRYYGRIDLTKEKRFTVSQISKNVLHELEAPLRITYYVSEELKNIYPQVRNISDFLYAYAAESRKAAVYVADPASRGIESTLAILGIPGRQISSAKKNKTELATVYSAIVIEYLEKTAVIPFILSADTLEYELTGRIMPLVQNRLREIYLMAGNGFSIEKDYSYVVPWLETAGFTCTVLEPSDFTRIQETLSSGTGVRIPLMVFGSASLSTEDAAAVEAFALSGGNIFFAVSPNTADIYNGWNVSPSASDNMIPVLESWGFGFGNELAADTSCFRMTLYTNTEPPSYEYRNYPLWIVPLPQYTADSPITQKTENMVFFWPSPLTLLDPAIKPLFRTSPHAYLSSPDYTKDQVFVTNPFLFDQSYTNGTDTVSGRTGQYTLAAAYEGAVSGYYTTMQTPQNDASIIVVSDQYFAATVMLDYTGALGNLDFLVNAALYLSHDNGLLVLRNKTAGTSALYKKTEAQLLASRTPITVITVFIIPLLCAAAGILYTAFRVVKKRRRFSKGDRHD